MQIKVRIEEIAAGAVLGASLGLAVSTPLAVGMPSLIPTFAAGAWGFVQSAIAFSLTVVVRFLAAGWPAHRSASRTIVERVITPIQSLRYGRYRRER
jgi:hypothetical protein